MAKFYITKYALTAGITVIEGQRQDDGWMRDMQAKYWTSFTPREVFETIGGAVVDAEARRHKRIASLRKQIAKLEKIQFATPEPQS